jgi:hypothetical protein
MAFKLGAITAGMFWGLEVGVTVRSVGTAEAADTAVLGIKLPVAMLKLGGSHDKVW